MAKFLLLLAISCKAPQAACCCVAAAAAAEVLTLLIVVPTITKSHPAVYAHRHTCSVQLHNPFHRLTQCYGMHCYDTVLNNNTYCVFGTLPGSHETLLGHEPGTMAGVTPGWQEQRVCKSWCVCRAPWRVCSMPGGWQETGAGAPGSSWCSRLTGRLSRHSNGHTP